MLSYIDSTYLKTSEQANISESENKEAVKSFIKEAIHYKFKLIMIRSNYISLARKLINNCESSLLVGTVIDFPSGNSSTKSKLFEIQNAINLEADDIDVVINYRQFKKEQLNYISNEVKYCTDICLKHNKTIKWIIESAALSNKEIISICQLIRNLTLNQFGKEAAHKVFIKSSTGFFISNNKKSSGATIEHIKLMVEHSFPLPVKASGGIRNLKDFNTMIELGVKRIGTSSALSIVQGKTSTSIY